MTFDLASLADGLEKRNSGIWFKQEKSEVSYPASGKAACLAVEDQSFWFRHRNRCIVRLVRRFAPDGAFLDIGGGNAFVSKGLVEAGFACALVEPGINGALAARERGVEHVICARLEDARDDAGRRNALEHALHGQSVWSIHLDSSSHLECFLVRPSSA